MDGRPNGRTDEVIFYLRALKKFMRKRKKESSTLLKRNKAILALGNLVILRIRVESSTHGQ